MTRTEEILSDISDRDCNHFFCQMGCENKLSPKKLASYLATLESSKDKDEDLTFEAPLTAQMVDEVLKIYPFKDEKNGTLAETAIGRLNNWNMGEHRHTPPSEEKKVHTTTRPVDMYSYEAWGQEYKAPTQEEKKCCEKCYDMNVFDAQECCLDVGCPCHSPTQEEKKCERHPNQKLCPSCNKHFCKHTCTDSPTPPDAWVEEVKELSLACCAGCVEDEQSEKRLIDWLRSKKKEWRTEGLKEGLETANKGKAYESVARNVRTTTLDEVARVVQSAMKESYNEGTYKYDWLYEDILKKIEELRANP